ncbi:hypothetical protein F5Y15DRAFT_173346 [Xylariaceae sp. FL0016]|nr:hypothetical protein F5Y15DRAFT_173346 [Xylariaceae sp. FL0016]
MDGTSGQKDARYPRAPSRASTTSSAGNTHATPKSATSSSSQLREGSQSSSHATHRYHHSQCGRSPVSVRPSSQLSRDSSQEAKTSMPPVSNFLQEKLQRERRAESERLASKWSGDLSTSVGDVRDRDVQASPATSRVSAAERRPMSNSGDDASSQTSMGAKHIEKAVSTLHKQNFDLKLELFHRREKQSALESQVEKLESEHQEMAEIQESLMTELEKRDKAVAEAVAMIVHLEARVDELVREKEMVRMVEADGRYRHSRDYAASVDTETPEMSGLDVSRSRQDSVTLERMPSFMSERSEQTQNLRNVVLNNKSSGLLHYRKISETSVDPSEFNRTTSPSLSMLSESSFMSIYGSRDGQDVEAHGMPPLEDMVGMDGSEVDRTPTPTKRSARGRESSARKPQPTSAAQAGSPAQLRSLNNMLDTNSPLQKLERMERQRSVSDRLRRPSATNHGRNGTATTPNRPTKPPQAHARIRGEQRQSLQYVLTGHITPKELAGSHTLPPTPDTVSSSVLRKHSHHTSSQDSLMKQVEMIPAGSLGAPLSDKSGYTVSSVEYQNVPDLDTQRASTTAFSSRRNAQPPAINTNLLSELAQSLPPRPHSATETMYSRARRDSFVSDSDESDGGVIASRGDNLDPWMRESLRNGDSKASLAHRAASPDLFSFPADGNGWETDVIFGALKGSGFLGSPVAGLKRDPLDEMASSIQTPRTEILEPPTAGPGLPPPSRRSSLHARTGSLSVSGSGGAKLRKSPARSSDVNKMETRGRSNSIDLSGQLPSAKGTQSQQGTPTGGKRSQYPPIAGLSKGRGLGLNSLFRRSGSESHSVPSSATEPNFPPSVKSQAPPQLQQQEQVVPPPQSIKPSGRSTVPPPMAMPWAMRPPRAFEEDSSSATPPPIQRNRAPSQAQAQSGGFDGAEASRPATPRAEEGESAPGSAIPSSVTAPARSMSVEPPSTGKRKWFGLGRMGSTKGNTG